MKCKYFGLSVDPEVTVRLAQPDCHQQRKMPQRLNWFMENQSKTFRKTASLNWRKQSSFFILQITFWTPR